MALLIMDTLGAGRARSYSEGRKAVLVARTFSRGVSMLPWWVASCRCVVASGLVELFCATHAARDGALSCDSRHCNPYRRLCFPVPPVLDPLFSARVIG